MIRTSATQTNILAQCVFVEPLDYVFQIVEIDGNVSLSLGYIQEDMAAGRHLGRCRRWWLNAPALSGVSSRAGPPGCGEGFGT